MKVYFVGAGPGDPDLITVKALNRLKTAPCCIYAGSLVNPEVLRFLPADAERHDSARMSLEDVIEVCQAARVRDAIETRLTRRLPAAVLLVNMKGEELGSSGNFEPWS